MLLAYFDASTALVVMPWAQDSLVRYALAVALMFLVTLVHELGHAAAVIRVGGTIKSIMRRVDHCARTTSRSGAAMTGHDRNLMDRRSTVGAR